MLQWLYLHHLFLADLAEQFVQLQLLSFALLLLVAATYIQAYIFLLLPDSATFFEFFLIDHQFLLRDALGVKLPFYSHPLR